MKNLSHRAVRLLAWLLLVGAVQGTTEEVKRSAGFSKREDVRRAVLELEQAGWVRAGGRRGSGGGVCLELVEQKRETERESLLSLGSLISIGDSPQSFSPEGSATFGMYLTSIRGNSFPATEHDLPAQTQPDPVPNERRFGGSSNTPTQGVLNAPAQGSFVSNSTAQGVLNAPPQGVFEGGVGDRLALNGPSQGVFNGTAAGVFDSNGPAQGVFGTSSLLSRMAAADRMSMAGPSNQPSSPFQARRRAQIPLVQEAWAELFPEAPPLIPHNIKELLNRCDQSSEAVYEAMQAAAQKQPRAPFAYLLGMLRRMAASDSGPVVTPGTAPSRLPPTNEPPPLELVPPTPEYLAQLKQAEEIARQLGIPV